MRQTNRCQILAKLYSVTMILERFPEVRKLSPSEKLIFVSELWNELEAHPSEVPVGCAAGQQQGRRHAIPAVAAQQATIDHDRVARRRRRRPGLPGSSSPDGPSICRSMRMTGRMMMLADSERRPPILLLWAVRHVSGNRMTVPIVPLAGPSPPTTGRLHHLLRQLQG